MMEEIATGARRDDDRQFPGFSIKRVIAAVGRVAPGNLRLTDAGRIGIGRRAVIVDPYLPSRSARRIGTGDGGLSVVVLACNSVSRHADRQDANS